MLISVNSMPFKCLYKKEKIRKNIGKKDRNKQILNLSVWPQVIK
jgi:hypothetical protein